MLSFATWILENRPPCSVVLIFFRFVTAIVSPFAAAMTDDADASTWFRDILFAIQMHANKVLLRDSGLQLG